MALCESLILQFYPEMFLLPKYTTTKFFVRLVRPFCFQLSENHSKTVYTPFVGRATVIELVLFIDPPVTYRMATVETEDVERS
jgi:hypothetical protein